MPRGIHHIIRLLMGAMLTAMLCGCVHIFPEEESPAVAVKVNVVFASAEINIPIYTEVVYTLDEGRATAMAADYDLRYTLKLYRTDGGVRSTRTADDTFVFTKPYVEGDYNLTAELLIGYGEYDIQAWVDYVPAGTQGDYFYDTHDFNEIAICDRDDYIGGTDRREAFRGYGHIAVRPEMTGTITATVDMQRPMGKFMFISTDLDRFLDNETVRNRSRGDDSRAKASDYVVQVCYPGFLPCAFNMFTDRPADSWAGVSFYGPIARTDEGYANLGFDYVLVNGGEATVTVGLNVYSVEGEFITSTGVINVPIKRNQLTIVRGEFLTATGSGGVGINPQYEGEFNLEIK